MKLLSFLAVATACSLGIKALPINDVWLVEMSTDPITDKNSVTVTLVGDYLPPQAEKPTIGLRCDGGKFKAATFTTGGLLMDATEESPHGGSSTGPYGGLGVRFVDRHDDGKRGGGWAHPIRGNNGFYFTFFSPKHFISADRYRVQFKTFPTGSLTAEFHPSQADNTRVRQVCGIK